LELMKYIFFLLLMHFGNKSISQNNNRQDIFLMFDKTDSIFQGFKESKTNKEIFKIYRYFKSNSAKYNKPNGYLFYHKNLKNGVFNNVEEKFWNAKSDTVKEFDEHNKVILDSDWFNKNNEDLVFSFFYTNSDYNYYLVFYDREISKYVIDEVVFGNISSYKDYYDVNDISGDVQKKYRYILSNKNILKVETDY
jgi:hypothetical protein